MENPMVGSSVKRSALVIECFHGPGQVLRIHLGKQGTLVVGVRQTLNEFGDGWIQPNHGSVIQHPVDVLEHGTPTGNDHQTLSPCCLMQKTGFGGTKCRLAFFFKKTGDGTTRLGFG
jgi:hypothetical protein